MTIDIKSMEVKKLHRKKKSGLQRRVEKYLL